MFESGIQSVPQRIVSLAQPWVQPIVRGKAHANTEFGAKLHISLVNGYARIERLNFELNNESEDLWGEVNRYRERYGCYPERVLADKIYRNQQTLVFCEEHGIRLYGPALGNPPKNHNLSRQAKKQQLNEQRDTLEKLTQQINDLEQSVKNSQIPADAINRDIEFIMGRKELVFSNSALGYQITRGGKRAKYQ